LFIAKTFGVVIVDDARVVILGHLLAIDGNAALAALRAATLS
jgi:hypothetical protein